jgi:hypothetical protein
VRRAPRSGAAGRWPYRCLPPPGRLVMHFSARRRRHGRSAQVASACGTSVIVWQVRGQHPTGACGGAPHAEPCVLVHTGPHSRWRTGLYFARHRSFRNTGRLASCHPSVSAGAFAAGDTFFSLGPSCNASVTACSSVIACPAVHPAVNAVASRCARASATRLFTSSR